MITRGPFDQACPQDIAILGAGGHATSVANVAMASGFRPIAFVDSKRAGSTFLTVPIVDSVEQLVGRGPVSFAIAVGDNAVRQRLADEFRNKFGELPFPSLCHPSSIVGNGATVEMGVVLMPLSVVGPNSHVGKFAIVNTHASIDHDCQMGEFASLAPGAVTGGGVRIGARSAISIGAVIRHGISIGEDVVVGAASYVDRDVEPCRVVYGTPAREIRTRERGTRYL